MRSMTDGSVPAKSIALTRFPQAQDMAADAGSVCDDGDAAADDRHGSCSAQRDGRAGKRDCAECGCMRTWENQPSWQTQTLIFCARLARVSDVEFAAGSLTGEGTRSTARIRSGSGL